MGTSVIMIEKHYSHLDAVKAVHQLRGEESRQLIESKTDIDEKYEFNGTKNRRSRLMADGLEQLSSQIMKFTPA
jgi:hypothetical protein